MAGKHKYLLLFLWTAIAGTLPAQDTVSFDPASRYSFVLEDGRRISGKVVAETRELVTIKNEKERSHEVVERRKIVRFEKAVVPRMPADTRFGINHHPGEYLFSQSALPLEPGQFSSNSHWFLYEKLEYSFNEHFALNAGAFAFYPCAFGTRLAWQLDEMNHIGISATVFAAISSAPSFMAYIAQGKFTHGTQDRNVTFGAGMIGLSAMISGNAGPSEVIVNTPVLSAGFTNRFAERWAVVLDGHFLPEETFMLGGFGAKFLRDDYSSWTFGGYSLVYDLGPGNVFGFRSFSFPIPYFSYQRKLN